MKNLLYIGLDVHKDSISIAVAKPGLDGEIRGLGKMSNTLHAVDKLIARLRNPHLRWLLIECSQHYAKPPKVSKELSRRQEGIPNAILKIS